MDNVSHRQGEPPTDKSTAEQGLPIAKTPDFLKQSESLIQCHQVIGRCQSKSRSRGRRGNGAITMRSTPLDDVTVRKAVDEDNFQARYKTVFFIGRCS